MRSLGICIALALTTSLVGCSGNDDDDPECGNNIVETGEMCEWSSAPLQCSELGLGEGQVTCNQQCQFVFSGCVRPPTCGNDVRDSGEACDGTDLGDMSCGDLGYDLGTLHCAPNCAYDLSACCSDGCAVQDDTRCVGDQVQACTEQTTGCLDWQDDEDCATLSPAHVCDATSMDAQCVLDCVDGCTTAGQQRCDALDSAVQTCALQASGCLDWADTEDCTPAGPTAHCSYDATGPVCLPCRDECSIVGTRQCDGGWLQECVEAASGCAEWLDQTDCIPQEAFCGVCAPGEVPACHIGC